MRSRRDRSLRACRVLIAVAVCAVMVSPLYWMVVVAFSSRAELLGGALRLWPRSFTTANFERVLAAFPVATWFGNSVAIALVVALITVGVSCSAGTRSGTCAFAGRRRCSCCRCRR